MNESSKVCVVMGDDRPVYSDDRAWNHYPSLTFAINLTFAQEKGWDLVYEHYVLPRSLGGTLEAYSSHAREHRAPTWIKLMAIDKAFDSGYDLVVWIDTDCVFYNHEADWDDLLGAAQSANIVAWRDKPFNPDQICAGFMLVRNTSEVRSLIRELWIQPTPYAWVQFHEQSELNAFLKHAPSHWVKMIDEPMFTLESESQRLLHVASFDTLLRVPYFSKWLRDRGLGPADQKIVAEKCKRDLHVDQYDARWSGRTPNFFEHFSRILRMIRSRARRKLKQFYRMIKPLKLK